MTESVIEYEIDQETEDQEKENGIIEVIVINIIQVETDQKTETEGIKATQDINPKAKNKTNIRTL